MNESEPASSGSEPVATVIGIGGLPGALLRLRRRLQIPALAMNGRILYRVMVEGSGFELRVAGASQDDPNPTGFFITRYIAAATRMEAEAKAKFQVLREWRRWGVLSGASGTESPTLRISTSEPVEGWFHSRFAGGFVFFQQTGEHRGPENAA